MATSFQLDHLSWDRSADETGVIVNRVALVTGLSGQDGSYLAEFLLERD